MSTPSAVSFEHVQARDIQIIERQVIVAGYDQQPLPERSKLDATLYTRPEVAEKYCKKLFGRQQLSATVERLLDESTEVLLCGLGGSGKTALAAASADRRLREGKGPVVWMACGSEDVATQCEALGRMAGRAGQPERERELKTLVGDARMEAVCNLLEELHVGLVVLDDARNGAALKTMLDAIPDCIPVLVTSRRRHAVKKIVKVGDLAAGAALDLLCHHADRDYHNDPVAVALCERLGFHAYALEIAGSRLRVDRRTPAELLRRIASAPHASRMPEDFAPEGRESVAALLDDSFGELNPEAQRAFLAFGALFAPGATSQLLAAYLQNDLLAVEDALDGLVRRSLASRDEGIGFYRLHDLTFSYVRAQARERQADPRTTVLAVQRYMLDHAHDFDLLELDQPNILGAAEIAAGETLVSIMATLAMGGYPQAEAPSYMDVHGHSLALLARLDDAIAAARQMGAPGSDVLHYLLSKRGNAFVDRCDPEQGLLAYRAALELAPSITRKVTVLSVMARVLAKEGKSTDARQLFEQAYQLAETHRDYNGMIRVLEQQSWAASFTKDFAAVRDLAVRGIEVSVQYGDRVREGYFRINLGSAELELGVRKALICHQEARAIAHELSDNVLMAHTLNALGHDYHALEQAGEAREHFLQGYRLSTELGNTQSAGETAAFMAQFGYGKPDPPTPAD